MVIPLHTPINTNLPLVPNTPTSSPCSSIPLKLKRPCNNNRVKFVTVTPIVIISNLNIMGTCFHFISTHAWISTQLFLIVNISSLDMEMNPTTPKTFFIMHGP
jgi:hypothetical protein